MTKRKSKLTPSTEPATATNEKQPTPESTRDLPEPMPALDNSTRVPEPTADSLETSTRVPEPTESAPENSARDSSLEFGNLTRAARILGGQTRSEYERARVNVPIIPAQRQQLDVLANEWDCTLTEAVRRVLDDGLSRIMHGPVDTAMAPRTEAA